LQKYGILQLLSSERAQLFTLGHRSKIIELSESKALKERSNPTDIPILVSAGWHAAVQICYALTELEFTVRAITDRWSVLSSDAPTELGFICLFSYLTLRFWYWHNDLKLLIFCKLKLNEHLS